MFGYVRVQKMDLRVREWETYRGLYCSLCRALSRRYGLPARLILSYDMTFLLLVRLAQSETVPSFRPGRCPFNPAKRCNYCNNGDEAFDYVCAAAVLMFYYKIRDNIADSRPMKRLLFYLLLPLAALWRKKAKRQFSQMDAVLASAMQLQAQTEAENADSIDKAAHASADALGQLMKSGAAENAEACYRFGYLVGRWVYLMDAADDIRQDLKTGGYNVFVKKFSLHSPQLTDAQKEEIFASLELTCTSAMQALEDSRLTALYPILENIVLDGMYASMEQVVKGENRDERSLRSARCPKNRHGG